LQDACTSKNQFAGLSPRANGGRGPDIQAAGPLDESTCITNRLKLIDRIYIS